MQLKMYMLSKDNMNSLTPECQIEKKKKRFQTVINTLKKVLKTYCRVFETVLKCLLIFGKVLPKTYCDIKILLKTTYKAYL